MGDEKKYVDRSKTGLKPTGSVDRIKLKTQKLGVCDAIFVPETEEIVVLTQVEMATLAKESYNFDKYINAVVDANNASNKDQAITAKEQLVEFIAKQNSKSKSKSKSNKSSGPEKALTTGSGAQFIEVIWFSGKKTTMIMRDTVDTFRYYSKRYPFEKGLAPFKNAYSAVAQTTKVENLEKKDVVKERKLRTKNGQLDEAELQRMTHDVSVSIKKDWKIVKPKAGQIKTKYLKYAKNFIRWCTD